MLETVDLSFSTPSSAGAASRPLLLSGQPEARHPTEADSVLMLQKHAKKCNDFGNG